MKLTNTKVKNAKATGKTYKLSDGRGMYLEISPTGRKWWRYKYRIDGKEKKFALGAYPDITLKDAREKLDAARKLVADEIDPVEHRKAVKASRIESDQNTFEVLVREWHSKNIQRWTKDHGQAILKRFEQNIFPWLGKKPISKITPQDLLRVLEKMQERGANETAHRVLQYCSKVCQYAIVTGRLDRDLTIGLKKELSPVQKSNRASITDPEQVAQLLKAMDGYNGFNVTKLALQLAPLVFVRPGELRKAKWSEIDFENAEWNIPAERMKMREPHLVPLSRQAITILKELHLITGNGQYIFPSIRTKTRPMSDNTILGALRRIGYSKEEMCVHGFRAMARTILDEVLGVRPDFIEHQLAHTVRDPNGRAYNRTAHLAERRKMMQRWADYLDELKAGIKVISLKRAVA